MDNPEFRSPTPNETDYLHQKIRTRKMNNRWGLALIGTLTVLFGLMTLWCFTQYFLGGLFIAIAFLAFCAVTRSLYYRVLFSLRDEPNQITPLSGVYRRVLEGSGKSTVVRHYIGDTSFEMPQHWFKSIKDGEPVTAEGYMYTFGYHPQTQVVRAFHPFCSLVSLHNKYFVDREVHRGLLEIKESQQTAWLFTAVLVTSFGIIFGIMTFNSGVSLPTALGKSRYDQLKPLKLATVAAALDQSPPAAFGTRVQIARAAMMPAPQPGCLYLYESTPQTQAAWEAFANSTANPLLTQRTKDLQRFMLTNYYILTSPSAWLQFDIFNDNPEFGKLKQQFTTEGARYFKTKLHEIMASESQTQSAQKTAALVKELETKMYSYCEPFLKREQTAQAKLQEKQRQLRKAKMPAFVRRHFPASSRYLLYSGLSPSDYESHIESILTAVERSLTFTDESLTIPTLEKFEGLLRVDNRHLVLDAQYVGRSSDTLFLYGVCGVLALLFALSWVRGISLFFHNRRWRQELERLYV